MLNRFRRPYRIIAQYLLVILAFGAFYHFQIASYRSIFLTALGQKPLIWIIASLLVGAASVLRVKRTKLLLDFAAPTSTIEQLRIWSAATIVNFFSPFRLGEIFRIFLLRRVTNISLLYVTLAVLIERLVDFVLIGMLFILFAFQRDNIDPHAVFTTYITAGTALMLIIGIGFFAIKNRRLFRVINRIAAAASEDVQWRFKHSLWVVIYGLQKFLHSTKTIARYLLFTIASWGLYLLAVTILIRDSLGNLKNPILVIAPFLSLGNLSNQSVSAYLSNIRGLFVNLNEINTLQSTLTLICVWVALNGLTIIYGLISLPNLNRRMNSLPSDDQRINEKFLRSSQFQLDLKPLVDLYVDENEAIRELHNRELKGELQILKVFRGGSQAITALVQNAKTEIYIDKSIPISLSLQLDNQYQWLERFKDVPEVVNTLGSRRTATTFSILLEYEEGNQPFHRAMHYLDSVVNEKYMEQVLKALEMSVYDIGPSLEQREVFDLYFQKRIISRLKYALKQSPRLREIAKERTILVNGVVHDNFFPIIDKIFEKGELKQALHTFTTATHVHGDLTIDNILINQELATVTIIDPSDDNEIVSPLIDYARLSQSLSGGYEFLNYMPAKLILIGSDNSSIDYFDQRTAKYDYLARQLFARAENSLGPSEFRSLDFHTGAFFARMLPHRLRIDEVSAPIYYAKAVEFLNRFYYGK